VGATQRARAVLRHVPGLRAGYRLARPHTISLARRVRPLRPPLEPPERVASLSVAPKDDAFITANGVAAHCRYVLNFDELYVNAQVDNDWWFCNAHFLEHFFRSCAPDEPYVLFTNTSDRRIDERFERRLRRRELVAWFAANAELRHPKLLPFPRGIADAKWPHGDADALKRVQRLAPPKTRLLDASFNIRTNVEERTYCSEQIGRAPSPPLPFPEYLEQLAASYFCVSPEGNGNDCHRTWEALYLRTVPIVTRTPLTDHHPDLPLIVLDDWSQFRSLELSPDLYEQTWGGFDPAALRLDRYLERVRDRLRALRSGGEPGEDVVPAERERLERLEQRPVAAPVPPLEGRELARGEVELVPPELAQAPDALGGVGQGVPVRLERQETHRPAEPA
jgi:hypothetical protein